MSEQPRLILPGTQPPRGDLTIFVPRGYEPEGDRRQIGECYLCGTPFFPGDNTARHFRDCAREHMDDVRAARAEQKKRLAVFQEENWDPELSAYLKKVGNRMLAEGRLEMKPNERSYD